MFDLPPDAQTRPYFIPPNQSFYVRIAHIEEARYPYEDVEDPEQSAGFLTITSGSNGTIVTAVGVERDDQIDSDFGLFNVSSESSQIQPNIEPPEHHIKDLNKPTELICKLAKDQKLVMKRYEYMKTIPRS